MYENNNQLVTKRFFNNGLAEIKNGKLQNAQTCITKSDKTESIPRSCKEIRDKGESNSGIYKIKPEHASSAIMVYCDMQTNGGGWTYIHNRFDGTEDFFLNWHDYKYGFGNIGGEFWLGLENIHHLTGKLLSISPKKLYNNFSLR